MKALELAEAYADAVSTHRLESLYGTSKSYTLEKAKERDEAHEALAAELRRLAAVESDCAQYLKEGETPAERIKRALGDAESLLDLYRDVMAERDALKAENERLINCLKKANDQAEDFERRWYLADMELERIKALPPVAWRTFDGEGGYDYRTYDMNESYAEDYAKRNPNHADWVEPLIALGSKT